MYTFIRKYRLFFILFVPVLFVTCSTKRNTSTTRTYHAINTKYNIYFNANEAYKEALKSKEEAYVDTFSQILNIYPVYPAKTTGFSSGITGSFTPQQSNQGVAGFISSQLGNNNSSSSQSYSSGGGAGFSRAVEKNTKAIKLHSIKSRPERNPAKRRDPKYQAWLRQQEFNPFLHNAWLLLGRSEYEDGDYLQAISTFVYITRIYHSNPEIVAEARMLMAKSNIALGWYYEAEDIFNQIRLSGGVPDGIKPEYNKIYADFLLKKEEYKEAIPFVTEAIGSEKDRLQRTRMKYLLGQLYKQEGSRELAYDAFDDVHGLSTPYLYSFNARIEQASFVNETNKTQIISQLNKMTRDKKNEEYLDQVYFAIGNIYLNDSDTLKAIENYKLSIDKSTRNGQDKAITEVVLGDIYFKRREYIKAQPIYSDALNILSKRNKDYPTVALRSSVLDELVVYVQAVHLQDSLQTLARMPENERVGVIYNLIAELKKKEEEERKRAERDALLADRELNVSPSSPFFEQSSPNIPTGPVTIGGDASSFYFYNTQIVAQGKAAFQRKWGTRKLEDNWRRRNKQAVLSFGEESTTLQNDSVPLGERAEDMQPGEFSTLNDIYSVDFYLQQIPLTPEAIEASNVIIEDAYFNMGKIYKDKLGDYSLAIEAFDTDLRRFPNTPNLEEIYYQLFLIHLKLGDRNMMELYRQNILNTFPNSTYAAALRDDNYQWNMLNMYQIEDNLYQQTYDQYLAGNVSSVRANYQSMKEKYPLSGLMPKFAFLNSLTYAQTQDLDNFKSTLTELVSAYPQSDVTPLASEMLKGILSGKALSSDSSPFRGMIWDIKLGGDSISSTEGVDFFIADADTDHMLLLIYRPGTLDKNQLIYEVANYNFSNYVYHTFDLGFASVGQLEILQVRGFDNLEDIITYVNRAFEENSLMSHIDPDIIPVPISAQNYIALMNGKTLNQYFLFFEEHYTTEMLTLIRYWNRQKGEAEGGEDAAGQEPQSEPQEKEEDKTELVVVPEVKVDPIDTAPPVKPQFIPESQILPKAEPTDSIKSKNEFGFGNIMSDDQIDKADNIINKAGDIISNPVDGLLDLFRSSGQDKDDESLTKEEKEAKKKAEKERKEQEKATERSIREAEKMKQDSIRNAEKDKIDAERALQKAKEDEIKAEEQAKKDAQKQTERERKEKEKARKEEQKQKEKARNEELKRKEQERKDRLKQREQERKEKLKQREVELKERERKARDR